MREIKAGQVWKDRMTGQQFTVLDHKSFDLIDNETQWFWEAKANSFDAEFEIVKDVEAKLSDLEIVQKALALEGVRMTLNPSGSANYVTNDYKEIDRYLANSNEILTWAKQTIGLK